MATATKSLPAPKRPPQRILLNLSQEEADAVHRLIGHHTAGGGPTQMLLENVWRALDDLRSDDDESTKPLTTELIDKQYQRNPVLDIKS